MRPRAQLLRTALVGRPCLRARRPGRRRSLRRGAAVLSCRRGENTATQVLGTLAGSNRPLHVLQSRIGHRCPDVRRGPPAFRLTSDGRHRARRGRVVPARLAFVAQPGVAQRLSHRGSVSQFRQSATALHSGTSSANDCLPRSGSLGVRLARPGAQRWVVSSSSADGQYPCRNVERERSGADSSN